MKPKAVRPALHLTSDCRAVNEILSRVGDKWTVLVVSLLGDGPLRFSELKSRIGSISQKMLTATLRGLEREGFVIRTVYPTIPPRVDYELTVLGRDLLVPVQALANWARANQQRVAQARAAFDKKNAAQAARRNPQKLAEARPQ
ncbi:MAG: winged helix-turn-helix transcriptional regulator [Pseudorhodoplanes sp.]